MKFKEIFWMFLLFITICYALTTEEGFSYDGKNGACALKKEKNFLMKSQFAGASHWDEKYGTCKGKHQSPININVLSVKKVKLPPLTFRNFHTQLKNLTLRNNGHTGALYRMVSF
jgi:carbonic anhydrase